MEQLFNTIDQSIDLIIIIALVIVVLLLVLSHWQAYKKYKSLFKSIQNKYREEAIGMADGYTSDIADAEELVDAAKAIYKFLIGKA